MTGEIVLPYPHQGQIAVRDQARRFNWLAAGRRWRKTTLFMQLAIESALDGKVCLWGAPTYDQVRIGWNETEKAAGGVFQFHASRMEVTYSKTGGKIIFRSLDDPNNARSHTADRVLMDEAAYIHPDAYYQVLRQMLMDTGGDLWAASTPDGRNWFFMEHVKGRERSDSMAWQIPTVGCEINGDTLTRKPHPLENPDVPWSEIAQMFETQPRRVFRQETMAEFIEGEGAVFRNIDACTKARSTKLEDHQGHTLVAGSDYAKLGDFSVNSVGCADCKCEVEIERYNEIDYVLQNVKVQSIYKRWDVWRGLGDSASIGEVNLDFLKDAKVPIEGYPTNSHTKKAIIIMGLQLALDNLEWQFLPDPVAKAELEAYTAGKTPTGLTSYSAPPGLHDDCVVARALMVHAANNTPRKPKPASPQEQQRRREVADARRVLFG